VTQYSAVQCLDTQHAGGDVTVGNGACVGVALLLKMTQNFLIFGTPYVMPGTSTNVRDSYTRKSNNNFHTDRNIRNLQPTFSPENVVRTDKELLHLIHVTSRVTQHFL